MSKKTSLENIANILNVSKVSVSRALKGQPGVSDELRSKILKTANDLGYSFQSLQPQRNKQFIFIVSSRFFLETDTFYSTIYYHIHKLCDLKHKHIALHIISLEAEQKLIIPNQILHSEIAGIFVGGQLSNDYLESLSKLDVPTIVIDYFSNIPSFSHVTVDNFLIGSQAAQYLINKGHTKIGFVGKKETSSNVFDRLLGVQKVLIENNLTLTREWIIDNHDPRTGLYSSEFTLPESLPTAFICHCDRAAFFLIESLRREGKNVPEDVSIISFDDTELALETNPKLTSIKIDRKLLANYSFELMTKKISAKQKVQRIYIETHFSERESVKQITNSR